MKISIKNVSRNYGDFAALNDVSLDIKEGSLTALLGPSGSASPHCCVLSQGSTNLIAAPSLLMVRTSRMSPRKSAASVLYSNTMLRLST